MELLGIKKKKPVTVFYISKAKISAYTSNGLFYLDFDPSWIVNLDVKKPQEVEAAVKGFIEGNKIVPGPFLIVIASETCFEKEWPGEGCNTQIAEVEKFVDSVPFEFVKWREYKVGKGCKVVAVNRELYETVQTELERLGFTVAGVIPQSMSGVSLDSGLSASNGVALIAKMEVLRTEASLVEPHKFLSEKMKEEDAQNKKQTLILLAVFGLLISLLVSMIIVMKPFSSLPKKVQVVSTPVLEPANPVVSTPTPVPSASVSASLKVQIFNGSKVAGQAGLVQKVLIPVGIKDTQTGNATEQNKGKTRIVFSSTVIAADREKILTALKTLFPEMTSLEGVNEGKFDVVITTGVEGGR
jgi:hypothetical protein